MHAFEGVSGLEADEAERLGREVADRQTHVLVNADAGAALGVATAMMLALVARRRHGIGQSAETSMLCTNAYVLSDDFLSYAGKEQVAPTDPSVSGRERSTDSTRRLRDGSSLRSDRHGSGTPSAPRWRWRPTDDCGSTRTHGS